MEKIKQHRQILLVLVIVLLGIFYWFAIRPMIVKRDCSWFTQIEAGAPAKPAFAGVTKEEADKKTSEARTKEGCDTNDRASATKNLLCDSYFSEQPPRPAVPVEPNRKVTREATKAQYEACLRHHGL